LNSWFQRPGSPRSAPIDEGWLDKCTIWRT
jgi:hypothetical protein